MREILYIRLPAAAMPDTLATATVEYALAPGDRPTAVSVQEAPLADVLALAPGHRLVVFVPGAEVRLAAVNVPARQPAKVLQAAPYQLEDQLAEDVDTLHFALGPRQADGSHPVAVVSAALMQTWLAPFLERRLRPEALVPETLALPWDDAAPRWSALCETAQVSVRSAAFASFCCAPEDLVSYLSLADPEHQQPLCLLTLDTAGLDYSRIDWPLELRPGYAQALDAFVRHYVATAAINLLQGPYSQRQDLQRHWRPWRAAALLGALAIGLSATHYGVETWRLGRAVAAQDEANLARFRSLFPAETRIVDLQVQLDQQLRALKGAGQSGGLFPLLEVFAQAAGANPGLRVQNIQFRDGALFLALKASDLQVVERLRDWFAGQRVAVLEVQSADAGAEGVQVRLKLTAV